MTALQTVRSELSDLLSTLGQSYDYLPGSAHFPAIVVGLPERIDHSATSGYWRVEIPIYVVTRSASPQAGEADLLDRVIEVVALLKANTSGTAYSSLRVVDTTDLYQLTVGIVEAHSASVNVSIMIPSPT